VRCLSLILLAVCFSLRAQNPAIHRTWTYDFSSPDAYARALSPQRERLRELIGAIDPRVPQPAFVTVSNATCPPLLAQTDLFTVRAVRWPVFTNVSGEGLLLEPQRKPLATIVALTDAGQSPEQIVGLASGLAPDHQFARRLAENGCEVLVPVLVERQSREPICRQAAPFGRHIVGYEVSKVLAGLDALERLHTANTTNSSHLAAIGYGDGGFIGLCSAALDSRIEGVVVSGFFDTHPKPWEEPAYRNIFGRFPEFGDVEIATLIAPRSLIIEYSPGAESLTRSASKTSEPDPFITLDYSSVESEFNRAQNLLKSAPKNFSECFVLISGTEGMATGPGSDRALTALLKALKAPATELSQPGKLPSDSRPGFTPAQRMTNQVKELMDYSQNLRKL
jgi:hypothetical protein